MIIDRKYFSEYRKTLGFSSQVKTKDFFGATDIKPSIDFSYLDALNERLAEMIIKVNGVLYKDLQIERMDDFIRKNINHVYETIKNSGIIVKLNNQGRRPEQVYYSWMRGYVFTNLFIKALSYIFEVDTSSVILIGDDDLTNLDTFKRTPKADLEIQVNPTTKVRIEMQTGFADINDIKQHKVLEAKKVFYETGIETVAIHFDIFNGQVAFIKLNQIEDNDVHWVTRQQMEGQTVFNISQNHFSWKLTETPNFFKEIDFD